LLDHARLLRQFGALERRVGPSGRDAIDHPARGHDDLANVAAGALGLVPDAALRTPSKMSTSISTAATKRPSDSSIEAR
jgi:hypothetical protein